MARPKVARRLWCEARSAMALRACRSSRRPRGLSIRCLRAWPKEMAMDPEDLEPRNRKVPPKPLDALSVADLEAYIAELESEIARARGVIDGKQSHKSVADALF